MRLVRGNHDKRAGDPPAEVGIECVDGPVVEPPFALAHHPTTLDGACVIAGHLHPCAVLVGAARQRERLPCFWLRRGVLVLPAFGEFTGCAEVNPGDEDEVWVVADDGVMRVR
jgi:metallophosphoesterase superfamily enzyme